MVEGKGAIVRQPTGLRRLVWRGWALPVILKVAIGCQCMAPALTGVAQGTISTVMYAATEKIAYDRNPSLKETLKVKNCFSRHGSLSPLNKSFW